MKKNIVSIVLSGILAISLQSMNTLHVQAEADVLEDTISDYAYVIDDTNHQVLADKNGEERMYPASMTKIMTDIVAMESLSDLDQTVTITDEMLDGLREMNASVAGFQTGDTPTVKDLLYGSALPSGADASNALAFTVAGDIPSYVELMNQKAVELGMTNTHFVNTTGLHDDDHYSTVQDIAKLLQYCIQNPTFVEVFSAKTYTTGPLASAPYGLHFVSIVRNAAANANYAIDEMIGAKSGYTDEAAHCLASWENVNGMEIITVTAHAEASIYAPVHIEDLATILSHLRNIYPQVVVKNSSCLKQITLHSLFNDSVYEVLASKDIYIDAEEGAQLTYTVDLPDNINLSNDCQEISYTLHVYADGEQISEEQYTCEIPADKNILTRTLRRILQLFQ